MRRTETTIILLCLLLGLAATANAQLRVGGRVADAQTGQPVEFASILIAESGQWAVSDQKGAFAIKGVPRGKLTLSVQCLGYKKLSVVLGLKADQTGLLLRLKPDNLKLDEVTVVAHRKTDEATTSYTIDRQTLDNQQILNIADVATLLPGGKTVNPTLMSDSRLALRSGQQEKGNASFGTAIEVDGIRLDNNAAAGETMAASTRTVSTTDVESIEIVTGIPSVEYGDLSNGIVKVNTRRGKSPFVVEGKLNQHTRQVALSKGLDLGRRAGMLNVSVEHARSFSDAASPYTAYQRNILSAHYMNIFMRSSMPLTLNVGLTGNVGGYNSEADPDEQLDDYTKSRDNAARGHLDLQWLLNRRWITNASLSASLSFADRRNETYASKNSASTQPYLHSTEEGYYMSAFLPQNEGDAAAAGVQAEASPIVLGPTGYWYVLGYHDSKPLSWTLKLKADWNRRLGPLLSRLVAGAQYAGSRNLGRGTYYADMAVAPTWREYRYDQLPTLHNLGLYAEEKLQLPLGNGRRGSSVQLTAGLRHDITRISGSAYGTVGSLSPRFSTRYVLWQHQQQRLVSDLQLHAGWGKSVKLPSMQVLYPAPSYSDLMAFASTSTADNTSYYAYYTHPMKAVRNPDLRWQYTNQTDLGVELNIAGTRLSLSAFHHKTYRPYMATRQYTPFAYLYTPPSALNGSTIAPEDRRFSIDRQSGIVTMTDATGTAAPAELAYNTRHTYTTTPGYTNATPISRYGLEWTVDFAQIRALHTQLRLDGNLYYYKGLDDVLFADIPLGATSTMASGQPYQYVGYYRGSAVTSTGSTASATIANGSLSRQANLNATLTTHLPRIRLIVSLRCEASLYNYHRPLSEFSYGPRGIVLADPADLDGPAYDGSSEDQFVALYPEYYTTWEEPDVLIPFAERFKWARQNDETLYNDLSKLVVRTNYAYTMNPNRLSAYYSANLSVTKEMGDHVAVSFYANNFFNNLRRVRSSQTGLETSLFGSGYIPAYYYGLSLRLKI